MMKSVFFILGFVVALSAAQRRPPNYSQDEMPDTAFDCRDKVVGGYYADQETDCQMFHVCVKVPGVGVQDYRFLCPNDTTFDQENQICANWYDIDCEASTLFYSDNFDLYRIDKGPVVASKVTPISLGPSTQRPPAALPKKRPALDRDQDDEEEFYLQRSETGDRRLQKDLLRGSSSGNFFNKNNGRDDDDDYKPNEKKPVEPQRINVRRPVQDNANKKKVSVRKLRKRPQNENTDSNTQQSYEPNPTTYAPSTEQQQQQQSTPQQVNNNDNRYVNRQNNRQSFRNQRVTTQNYEIQKSTFEPSPSTVAPTFNERTTRTQFQPRYNTISRQTQVTTTPKPISFENNHQSRNNRPRVNNNFVSKSTPQEYTTTQAPTTRNYNSQPSTSNTYNSQSTSNTYNSQPSTSNNYNSQSPSTSNNFNSQSPSNYNTQPRGFSVASSTVNYQNAGSFQVINGDFVKSTTFAPVTYNGNYKANVRSSTNKPEYQDYNGNFDSYGNQRDTSDEFVESGKNEEEFLKTAPSNNIRPSNFNNFNKLYTDNAENQKSTTNFNYDVKNSNNDFSKSTQNNNFNSFRSTSVQYTPTNPTTKRPTTQFYQSTTQQPKTSPTTYTPPKSAQTFATNPTSYRPVASTTVRYNEPSKTTAAIKKATEAKLNGGKVKDVSYDYAYYDDTEYEGADPISDHHFGKAGESQRLNKSSN